MRFSNKEMVGTSGLLHFYDDILVQVPILFLLCWTGRSPYGTLPVAAETDPCCDVLFASGSIGGRSSFKTSLCESKSFSNNSLSQPRLTSCQLLSMMSIVLFDTCKNEILGEVVQLFCEGLNISLVQGQGILDPTKNRSITIRVA